MTVEKAPAASPGQQSWTIAGEKLVLSFAAREGAFTLVDCRPGADRP
jgi:hypothetical protein